MKFQGEVISVEIKVSPCKTVQKNLIKERVYSEESKLKTEIDRWEDKNSKASAFSEKHLETNSLSSNQELYINKLSDSQYGSQHLTDGSEFDDATSRNSSHSMSSNLQGVQPTGRKKNLPTIPSYSNALKMNLGPTDNYFKGEVKQKISFDENNYKVTTPYYKKMEHNTINRKDHSYEQNFFDSKVINVQQDTNIESLMGLNRKNSSSEDRSATSLEVHTSDDSENEKTDNFSSNIVKKDKSRQNMKEYLPNNKTSVSKTNDSHKLSSKLLPGFNLRQKQTSSDANVDTSTTLTTKLKNDHIHEKRDFASSQMTCCRGTLGPDDIPCKMYKMNVNVDGKTRDYECKYNNCGATYFRKEELKRHVMTKHLKTKNYQCPKCDKWFSRKDHLTQHLKTHTNRHDLREGHFLMILCIPRTTRVI